MKVSENVALRTKVTFNTKFDTYADPIYNEMFIGIGQKKSDTMWDEEKSGYEVWFHPGYDFVGSEGKSFAEIDEGLYFNQPQLCEDEPLFAVMLDLKYRYYLEKGDMEKAAACLNRLASVLDYMPLTQAEKVAAELVYMASLRGELEIAEETQRLVKIF